MSLLTKKVAQRYFAYHVNDPERATVSLSLIKTWYGNKLEENRYNQKVIIHSGNWALFL